MTVLRVSKKNNTFVVLDKTCLTQTNISWGAKGLHSYLMSLPPDWRVNVNDLKNRATNGRDSVRGLLNELKQAGYIVKEQIRDETTGKFSCLEYIIHELPQNIDNELPGTDSPETALPSPAIPETAKPTLININDNKYTNKKIIKAAAKEEENCRVIAEEEGDVEKAAAAFFGKKTQEPQKTPSKVSFIHPASPEDSVIGKELTPYQHQKLESMVKAVAHQGFCVTPKEIEYCLLSSDHFKLSGKDFGRKLNAIRTVILRGEWQTPVWLVLEEEIELEMEESLHKAAIDGLQMEIIHFQRLFDAAKSDDTRACLLDVLSNAKNKMKELKEKYSGTE